MLDKTWRQIYSDFPDHPKTKKLVRIFGEEAIRCVLRLWFEMDVRFPDGIFRGESHEDIDEIAGRDPADGSLVAALIECGMVCEWKDIEGTRKRKSMRYINRWYKNKEPNAPKFETPDDVDIVWINWYINNKGKHPDVIAEKSARGRKNQGGRK